MDANQRWDVGEAISWVTSLAPFRPLWIEEPTSPDDILGHATISKVRGHIYSLTLCVCVCVCCGDPAPGTSLSLRNYHTPRSVQSPIRHIFIAQRKMFGSVPTAGKNEIILRLREPRKSQCSCQPDSVGLVPEEGGRSRLALSPRSVPRLPTSSGLRAPSGVLG